MPTHLPVLVRDPFNILKRTELNLLEHREQTFLEVDMRKYETFTGCCWILMCFFWTSLRKKHTNELNLKSDRFLNNDNTSHLSGAVPETQVLTQWRGTFVLKTKISLLLEELFSRTKARKTKTQTKPQLPTVSNLSEHFCWVIKH